MATDEDTVCLIRHLQVIPLDFQLAPSLTEQDAITHYRGIARSGGLRAEQILASHSLVEGTKELANIPRLVQHLNGRESNDSKPRYPAVLAELGADQLRAFGEKFIADTQAYRHGKPFLIDKMPNNFSHIGLIHLILPNAKIIDARREPMALLLQ